MRGSRWFVLLAVARCWACSGARTCESAGVDARTCAQPTEFALLQLASTRSTAAAAEETQPDNGTSPESISTEDHERPHEKQPVNGTKDHEAPVRTTRAVHGAPRPIEPHPSGSLQPGKSINGTWVQKVVLFGLLVGGVFGMMGAGGSMILKPVLYYGFEVAPFRNAIFHGYVILFVLAMAAAGKGHVRGLVSWRMVAVLLVAMGIGSLCGSFQASLVPNHVQVWGFAVMLICVAAHMAMKTLPSSGPGGGSHGAGSSSSGAKSIEDPAGRPWLFKMTPRAALLGMGAGLMSGFMGVGGGFILVPVVCELGLDMERAVPTAQAVVSLSAFLGFCYYMLFMGCSVHQLDVMVTTSLTLTGLFGIAASGYVASLLSNVCRQRLFAGMLAAIAVGMMVGQSGLVV